VTYRLRYFFDAGSGVCVWAGDAATEARFGYAVDLAALPLSDETRWALGRLIAAFDRSIDWADPAGTDARRAGEPDRFADAAREGLALLRRELAASGFEVVDESGA
jgi:hypothetical protein